MWIELYFFPSDLFHLYWNYQKILQPRKERSSSSFTCGGTDFSLYKSFWSFTWSLSRKATSKIRLLNTTANFLKELALTFFFFPQLWTFIVFLFWLYSKRYILASGFQVIFLKVKFLYSTKVKHPNYYVTLFYFCKRGNRTHQHFL